MNSFNKIIILIINLFVLIKNQSSCKYNDCFNCSICGSESMCDCYWNPTKKECEKDTVKSAFNYNFDYFLSCYDEESNIIQRKYCGNSNIKLNEENYAYITLIDNDKLFAAQNLYCAYIYDQVNVFTNNNIIIKIVVSPSAINNVKIYLTINNNENKITKKSITKGNFEENFKNTKKVKIELYFKDQLTVNPLSIKITKKEEKKNYNIYISIGIIILTCLVCGLIIFFISKKAAENAKRRQEIYLRMARESQRRREAFNQIIPSSSIDPSSSESELSAHEINTIKIEKLLNTTLAPIKYNKYLGVKDGNPCLICTICIEEFKEGKSKVCITPCQHVFHFKCLKDWLMKNVLTPKCPNCNYNLLQEEKNEMACSQGIYDIPEIAVNVMRSHDHRPTNIGGRVSYNEHNNSINLEANGIDTGENRFINRNEMHRNRSQNNCINSVSNVSIRNTNVNKSGNIAKDNANIETKGNKDDDNDEVVIENIENNEITN